MSKNDETGLTLESVRNCLKTINRCLVYWLDSHFNQVTSQPKWMRALISQDIIDCIAQNSGEIENTEASYFMNKRIDTPSHNINAKLQLIYAELVKEGFKAVFEEEKFIQGALSRCAYIKGITDSKKWESSRGGSILKVSFEKELEGISTVTTEGKELADTVKRRLLESMSSQIKRQCLLFNESAPADIDLDALDAFKLLTAIIVVSLNYRNTLNSVATDNSNAKTGKSCDELSLFINSYLLQQESSLEKHKSKPAKDGNIKPSQSSTTFDDKSNGNSQSQHREEIDLEQLIQSTDAYFVSNLEYDISTQIIVYLSAILESAKNRVFDFEVFQKEADQIVIDIRVRLTLHGEKISTDDPLYEIKKAALSTLEMVLMFQLTRVLLEFSTHLLSEAAKSIQKEGSLRRTIRSLKYRLDYYEKEENNAQERLNEKIDLVLSRNI